MGRYRSEKVLKTSGGLRAGRREGTRPVAPSRPNPLAEYLSMAATAPGLSRWSRATPSSGRRATCTSPNCTPKPASCASCRRCSVPSASAPPRPGSARWTPCATCGARRAAGRPVRAARLRVRWLETPGQGPGWRCGQPGLPTVPVGRHADRYPAARPVRLSQPPLRRPAVGLADRTGMGVGTAGHLPHAGPLDRRSGRGRAAGCRVSGHGGEPAQERQCAGERRRVCAVRSG